MRYIYIYIPRRFMLYCLAVWLYVVRYTLAGDGRPERKRETLYFHWCCIIPPVGTNMWPDILLYYQDDC